MVEHIFQIKLRLEKKLNITLSNFSDTFLERAIDKRMRRLKLKNHSEYLLLLFGKNKEYEYFYQSLSINVTQFFRDPEVWKKIQTIVIPKIFHGSNDKTVKIWCAGCASGEEAYTIAMLFKEFFGNDKFKVYATDKNTTALTAANIGKYKKDQFETMPNFIRRKYFKIDDECFYQLINDDLKKHIHFSKSELEHPPTNNFDIIFCRNVMIYFNENSKEKMHRVFYDSLVEGGFLVLGKTEFLVSEFAKKCFDSGDSTSRIYVKRNIALMTH